MKPQLRHLIADTLAGTKSYNLPSVCERLGLESGSDEEAFSGKARYVMRRLEKLSDDRVLQVAKLVLQDYADDKLRAAVEQLGREQALMSDITKNHLAKALDDFSLSGSEDLLSLLGKYWNLDRMSQHHPLSSLADDIRRHATRNEDWNSSDILKEVGFFESSQAKIFEFLVDVVHPIRRVKSEQETIVSKLNPILRRDGYWLAKSAQISGYPTYKVVATSPEGVQPADELISKTLESFDENGVHSAWQKALERRARDPEGAITAAKTLLESVCKHIVEEANGSYGENDDLPKLYHAAAEHLNLAPSQHSEPVFKAILGNCHSIVNNLSGLRNKLGDSHGQGKRQVKPVARHAELAVNLAGSVAMFLISTWNARTNQQTAA